jgi:glycosyltransferase involved in cell wall biosynthesis
LSAPLRILELRSVRGTGGGPEKTILLASGRADPRRFAVTVCYIRDRRDGIFAIDERARAAGVQYVEVHERHSFDPAIWPALRRLVREREIDIVHAHEYKTDLLALLLARAEGVRPLATVHGWTGRSLRERLVYYRVDKRLLARFPLLVAVSDEIRRELVRAGARAERVRVVLNAIDHRAFRRERAREAAARAALGIAAGETAIGAVGRLEAQKRFDLLLRAFADVAARRPELRLFLAGDGARRAELEALAAELGLSARCRFLGQVGEVARLHEALDLFVQSSDYEGTPNAVLEAMALETPLVATDVGGTREVAADGVHGLLVPPGDAAALAAAIERALADPEAARRRAAAARARVERELSFDARMEAMEAIYEELAAARAARP